MTKDEIQAFEPIVKVTAEAYIVAKTIQKHYVRTISKLTGKPEEVLSKELEEIDKTVREEITAKLIASLNSSKSTEGGTESEAI